MPSLPDLPTELRQEILRLALPDTNRIAVPWPPQITSLFLVSKTLFRDMATVMETWSPLHHIASASAIPRTGDRRTHTAAPKLARICLDLFHAADVARISWTCYCSGAAFWTHPELVAAWAAAVPRLPRCAAEIHLDVTPAPAAKREQHPLILNQFLRDKRASRTFLAGHVRDVGALVRRIDEHYCGRARIVLTGALSARSAFFVEQVGVEAGRDVEFVGSWAEVRIASLGEAVLGLTSRKHMWQGKRRGDGHPMAWLRVVEWNRRTVFLFARLADKGLEVDAVGDVKRIAEFRGQDGRLSLEPAESLRRAFQHRVAADLGFETIGEGEEGERHVAVW